MTQFSAISRAPTACIFGASNTVKHVWSDFHRALRGVPPNIVHGMMAAAALCVLVPALALATGLRSQQWHVSVAPSLPAEVAVPEPLRGRCAGCGVVETIRELPEANGAPAGFEFTVRLHDGSLRTTTSPGLASWRVGDHIILIGGDDARL
jgi:hypothetical protein